MRIEIALQLEPLFQEQAKENQIRKPADSVCKISDKQKIDTKKEVAELAGVSHDTVNKYKKLKEKAPRTG